MTPTDLSKRSHLVRTLALSLAAALAAAAAIAPPSFAEPAAAVAARSPASPASAVTPREARLERALQVGDEWFGLYVLGQKAGTMFQGARRGEFEGRPVLIASYSTLLNAAIGGKKVMREVKGERLYALDGEGPLLAFREERIGDGGDETLTGRCTPAGVELTRQAKGGAAQVHRFPATRENLDDALASLAVLETGAPHAGVAFDLESRMADKRVTTSLVGRRTESIDGAEVTVSELAVTEEDSRVAQSLRVLPDGRTIEVRYGNVLLAKAEPRATAEAQGHVEVFGSTRIVLGGEFSLDQRLAEHVRRPPSKVVYEIEGLPRDYWTSNGWQSFAPARDVGASTASGAPGPAAAPERVWLTVTAALPQKKLSLPLAPALIATEKLGEWLRPTLAVESQAPEIVALTRKTLGKTTDAFAAVEKLSGFVYRLLKKSYGVSSDRATRVLELKEGDCTEHALLFTAMARAAGIPARRVNGLVYMDTTDGVPSLYWHEWAEAFVGEWIPVDPTFGQRVADTGHLAFGIEGQNDVAALFGQLKIRVVEVAPPPARIPANPRTRKNQ